MAAGGLRQAKQNLRRTIRDALKGMTAEERGEESKKLVEKLFEHQAYQKAQRISVYLSMPNEVDTTLIIEDIFAKNKMCYIPRFDGKTMDMLRVYSIEDIRSLPTYKWDIKQPGFDDDREDAIKSGGLDLVIVPGLGFTDDGKRLGQGKGYYDGFLSRCFKSGYTPVTIALAFGVQRCQDVPTGPNDINIDYVIFP